MRGVAFHHPDLIPERVAEEEFHSGGPDRVHHYADNGRQHTRLVRRHRRLLHPQDQPYSVAENANSSRQ